MDDTKTEFLTVLEVATILRVSKMTVYRLLQGGSLPCVKFGRSFRIHKDDFAEYVESSKV